MVYNGDEVSALVVDFGSYTTRAGYAGEDCPRVVCPSFFGYTLEPEAEAEGAQDGGGDVSMSEAETAPTNGNGETSTGKKGKRKLYIGEDGVGVWRKGMEVDNMMLDGVLHDTEAAGALLHHILHKRLSVDPSEHPLMLTEPAWNTSKAREQLAEMAFEGEKVPALYFGSAGVLSAFAAGKPTALVLDVGYANSSAVPVVDGYALRAGTKRQPLASQLITSQLLAHLSSPPASSSRTQPISLLPHALIAKRSPNADAASAPGQAPPTRVAPTLRQDRLAEGATTASWRNWAEMSVVEQWKEACLEVVPVGRYDKETTGKLAEQVAYEFPDGWGESFGEERFREGEVWYDPKNYFDQSIEPPAPLRLTQTTAHSHSLKDSVSLSQLVHDSIMACDVDIRAALLQNIVVVGNGAGTRGLTERLDWELAALMPSQKIKIHSPTIPYEKRYAGWLGGSILASLGTFHQLWVTKDEYEEHGMQIIHQRVNYYLDDNGIYAG